MNENGSNVEGRRALKQANRSSDYLIYALNVGLAITGIIGIALVTFIVALAAGNEIDENGLTPLENFFQSTMVWSFAGVAILVVVLVGIRMMRQQYLGNALQVEYSDYAWLRAWSNKVAQDLDMPPVEIMVTQDPVMNAFAFGFARPYTIVLNSGTIRWLNDEQLKAIVVHEMAHVKYRHTQLGTYASMLRVLPGVGTVFGWMIDFWSRRCELTADRLALCYLKDPELVKTALIRVHVGPDVADSFNDVARQWQVYMASNMFNRFTQTFSSHPFLVRRLQHIDASYEEFAATWGDHNSVQKTEKTVPKE